MTVKLLRRLTKVPVLNSTIQAFSDLTTSIFFLTDRLLSRLTDVPTLRVTIDLFRPDELLTNTSPIFLNLQLTFSQPDHPSPTDQSPLLCPWLMYALVVLFLKRILFLPVTPQLRSLPLFSLRYMIAVQVFQVRLQDHFSPSLTCANSPHDGFFPQRPSSLFLRPGRKR